MTEMVLLFPLFMFFCFALIKVFAILVLVQRVELAAFYAARRWQLESHRNASYEAWDESTLLRSGILKDVKGYLGCNTKKVSSFMDMDCKSIRMEVKRAQVWNVVRLIVPVRPLRVKPLFKFNFRPFVVTKYVPNRDRPIGFNLPGL